MVKKIKTPPQPFQYNGYTFKPIELTKEERKPENFFKKLWGDRSGNLLEKLKPIKFDYETFYETAKQAGCLKVNIFEVDGEIVAPTGSRLQYYGQPKWYNAKKEMDKFQDEQRLALEQELINIGNSLRKRLEVSFDNNIVPEIWKGGYWLEKAVIDSYCRDRPYQNPIDSHRKISEKFYQDLKQYI